MRVLGVFSCTMLVIGNMIGVGIFTTPGRIATLLDAPLLVFLAWGVGGLLAMAGALAYAELGAMYPKAGGNYIFLKEAYGPFWGFLYGWSASLITQSGTAAVLAVGYTKYAGIENAAHVQATAIGLILVIGALNYIGVKVGAAAVNFITGLKIAAILGFAVAVTWFGHAAGSVCIVLSGLPEPYQPLSYSSLALALIPIMYAYSGWNASVYVGSEIKNPGRTIPLSLIGGVAITGALYLLLNAVYLHVMPISEMRGVIAIAREVTVRAFSPGTEQAVSTFIAFSVLGCLIAHLLTAPRIPYALAQDGYFFKMFANVHPRFLTPANAVVLVSLWAAVLAFWGGVDHKHFYRLLDDYVTVPSLLINALTVAAVYVLRKKQPTLARPYRAWGYPVLPALFILVVLGMTWSSLRGDPWGAATGLGMIAAGAPFYLLFSRRA